MSQEPRSWSAATPDGDVLHGDMYVPKHARGLAVVCHGLEGHARRPYVLGMSKALLQEGFAVLAWNYRSCGGIMNQQARFYHSGATDDLAVVLRQIPEEQSHLPILLVGFSLGGNLVLRFLAEQGDTVSPQIQAAAAVSVPLFLADSADYLQKGISKWYARHFIKTLEAKIKLKSPAFPGLYRTDLLGKLNSLRDFDEHFTAPIHGYAGADDYYARASAGFVLQQIQKPVLLLQAQNDPFLPSSCFPAVGNHLITCDFTSQGGHCGFVQDGRELSYADERVVDFWKKL